MRYLRVGGMVVSLAVLLAAMALQMNALVQTALLICLAGIAICYVQKPTERATTVAPAVCLLAAGLSLLALQTDDPFLLLETAEGSRAVPAGESAYRTLGACLYALLLGLWLGETASEGLLGRTALGVKAGWAGAPVRVCAFACALVGMAICAVPALSEWIAISDSAQGFLKILNAMATAGVACYIPAARSKIAALVALLLYLACAVFNPELFAMHAFFALVFSVLLSGRGDGPQALVCLVPVPIALAAVWFYRVEGSALSLYAEKLSQALVDFWKPGGMAWVLQVYARLGIFGCALVGAMAGVLLFLLGRLLRDSFLYAAPSAFFLTWGCLALLKGVPSMPSSLSYAVFFALVYGLCLIVGCVRRTSSKKRQA